MKKYKVRVQCVSYQDVVVLAPNKEKAKELAVHHAQCPQNDMEFCEFLPLEKWDKVDYTYYSEKTEEKK